MKPLVYILRLVVRVVINFLYFIAWSVVLALLAMTIYSLVGRFEDVGKKVEKFSPKYFVDWRKVTNFALGKEN